MTESRFARWAAILSIAISFGAHAQNYTPDSTAIRSATALGSSVCANLTANASMGRQFYRTVPVDYFKDASTGDCIATGQCTYGVNASGNGCNGVPPGQSCPTGTFYNSATKTCIVDAPPVPPLYDCPAFIWTATTGPKIPLAEAVPAVKAPDGHEWCYYYGRGMAGGGDDGGDPWAGAFDRVVGKAVTYFPLWQEVNMGVYDYQVQSGGDSGFVDYYHGVGWGLPNASAFKGVVPIYGAPSSYSTTNATIGGSKCAAPRPAGTPASNNAGYWYAWYPSDCKGHGDSNLIVVQGAGGYIGGGPCLIDLIPGSPGYKRGYTRMQIGQALVAGGPGPFMDAAGGTPYFVPLRGDYPQFGCQPGAQTGTAVDANAPVAPPPPPDTGGGS